MWGQSLTLRLCSPGAQSESAQSKMLSGVGGFVLGLIFLGLGLIVHHRSQKGKELWGNGKMGCDCNPLLRAASASGCSSFFLTLKGGGEARGGRK